MSGPSVLQCRVRKKLPERQGQSFELDVDFEVPPGITVLFGHSGAGKTTLLDCIAGIISPNEGSIALGGIQLYDSAANVNVPPRARRLGYVFQTLALFPHLTVRDNVEFGLFGLSQLERRSRSDALLNAFAIEHLSGQFPRTISGGERQRAALARALVTRPLALLLDEPLAALDFNVKQQIANDLRRWLRESQERGHPIPVLYVTHALDEVFSLAQHVVVLEQGKIVRRGNTEQVLRDERESLLRIFQRTGVSS
jgi:molybdate transport system ATP-binding protein